MQRTAAARCRTAHPKENVWQFMRENCLSNRVFKSHQQIVDLCCEAWNSEEKRNPGHWARLLGRMPPAP
jgi:hypothetical protein